jgi:NADH pyrophosphatase NudC (nudix superfamily)
MAISTKTCRDCGNVVEQKARGCRRCARNIEAENMIERFIWLRLVPCVIVLALVAGSLIYFLR